MQPVDFLEKNFTYTKPQGWTDEQCGDLPVWKGESPLDNEGNTAHCIISKWEQELTDEQLAEIVQSRKVGVYLNVIAQGQPPCSLSLESPFVQEPQMVG